MKNRLLKTLTADALLLSPLSSVSDQRELGFLARKGGKRWKVDLPLNWKADPFKDNNWKFNLSAWRMMDCFIFDYLKDTTQAEHLEACLHLALDWYSFNILFDNNYTMRWYDMATGLRALRLAFLIDRIQSGHLAVTNDQDAALRSMAEHHLLHLLNDDEISLSNHGIFQMVGLYILSDVYCEEAARDANILFCN